MEIFKSPQFGEIRTILNENEEPMFCLVDLCRALDISNSRQAKKRLYKKGVYTADVLTNGGKQQIDFISESNMYKLIFQSRKKAAETFTEWVTGEVLPTIRKKGAYLTEKKAKEIIKNPESLADLLVQAGEQIKRKDMIIQEMKAKETFFDAVEGSKNSILIGDLAKILKQNGIDTGQNRLYTWMRDNGYLINSGTDRNMPKQKYIDQGLFEIRERVINLKSGINKTTMTTVVTGKGQAYFIKKNA